MLISDVSAFLYSWAGWQCPCAWGSSYVEKEKEKEKEKENVVLNPGQAQRDQDWSEVKCMKLLFRAGETILPASPASQGTEHWVNIVLET